MAAQWRIWFPSDDRSLSWHVRAFGTNLTDVLGVTSAGSLYRGYDDPRYRIESVIRPRTIGIGVDYKFE